MKKIDALLRELENLLHAKDEGYFAKAEICLAEIASINEPESIEGLLRLFDDSAPDELMFLIVHTIERWDDRTYIGALLHSVERLSKLAPRWAQILHIRIMNSPCMVDVYLKMVESASCSTRDVAQIIFESIAKGWPKLADKTIPIISLLSSSGIHP